MCFIFRAVRLRWPGAPQHPQTYAFIRVTRQTCCSSEVAGAGSRLQSIHHVLNPLLLCAGRCEQLFAKSPTAKLLEELGGDPALPECRRHHLPWQRAPPLVPEHHAVCTQAQAPGANFEQHRHSSQRSWWQQQQQQQQQQQEGRQHRDGPAGGGEVWEEWPAPVSGGQMMPGASGPAPRRADCGPAELGAMLEPAMPELVPWNCVQAFGPGHAAWDGAQAQGEPAQATSQVIWGKQAQWRRNP